MTDFESIYGRAPEATATAPGRLEFIGNHTDYNGGLVMGVAIDRGITVSVSKRQDSRLIFRSTHMSQAAEASLSSSITPFAGEESWANYALGVFDQLLKAGMKASVGFDMAVNSDLPPGAGMSSSAAFELSTARALGELYGFTLSTLDWARLGRRAENEFVGVPCGILDQGVSAFGKKDHLVRIDCQTETFERVPMPTGLHFWVFNTGVKHALVDSLYATRHRECMEALNILRRFHPELPCLAAASTSQVEAAREALGDVLTRRALHITGESQRVADMEKALAAGDLIQAGQLLIASHESSRDLFENSCPELDHLVTLLRDFPGVLGCRLTGGGFGGAVMAVTSPEFNQSAAEQIAARCQETYGHTPTVIHTRSGDGARVL